MVTIRLIQNKSVRQLLSLSILLALFLFVPVLAFAIPGSGDFIATESPSGRALSGLYDEIVYICLAILILVEVVLVFAIVKFRRTPDNQNPVQSHGYMPLEIGWTLAVIVIQVYMAFATLEVMDVTEVMPETEITVEAIAYQWGWQFKYPDYDNMLTDDLVIPAHKNVRLEVTSKDVIHSIFIPELGVKIDAVPGRYNYWWFNADGPVNQVEYSAKKRVFKPKAMRFTTRPAITKNVRDWFKEDSDKHDGVAGLEDRVTYLASSREVGEVSPYAKYSAVEYRGMCTELCGKGHYNMYFRTVAMTDSSFKQWVFDQKNKGGEADGKALFAAKCASCHGKEGKGSSAFPPLVGTEWMKAEKASDHIEVVLAGSNATSLKSSPTTIAGKDYAGRMAAWNEAFNDAEIAAIVNHERTSWGNDGGKVTEEDVAKKRDSLGLPPFPAGGSVPIPDHELLSEGKNLYSACSSCHGEKGESVIAGVPNLKGNPMVLADTKKTISVITTGLDTSNIKGSCPPMGESLSAMKLSSLLTYIRKSFGNDRSAVQPEEARRLRNEIKK